MAKKAGLQLIISLVDEATSGLQKITGSMKGLAVIGGAAVVAGMAAVGKAAWDAGQIYDEVMDGFVAKTGASGPALAQLETDFKAVFSSIPTDAKTAGDAMAILAQRTELTGPAMQDVTRQVLEMSRLLQGDASANATGYAKIMESWGVSGAQASLGLDKIFVAAQNSGVGLDTLMQSVTTYGPVMRGFGFTLDESVALLANLEKGGVNGEKAIAALRIAAGNFSKEGVPLREGLLETIAKIKAADNETDALALGMKTFGARGAFDMVAAIRAGKLSTEDLVTAMGNAEGAIMKTADATNDFPEKFQVLKNKVTTLLMPLGSIMVSGLTAAVDAIGPAIDSALAWIQKIGGEGTALGGMWKNLQTIAQAVWPGLRDAIVGSMRVVGDIINDYVVPALSAIFAWLATNLPPAIQAASDFFNNVLLPALTVVAGFIRDNVIPVVVEIITWLATNLPPAIQAASNFFNTVLLPAITAVANFITTQVIPALVAINDWLGAKIGPVIEIARAAFEGVLLPVLTLIWDIIVQKLLPIIQDLNRWLGATIIVAIGKAKQAFAELKEKLDPVLKVIQDIVDWIKNQLQPTIDGLKEFLGKIKIPNPFGGLLDTINDIVGAISHAIDLIREFLKLKGSVGGNNAGYATGTFFAPGGMALVGERGPELVALPRGSRVYSAGETQRMGGGSTFYFQFAAPATAYDERRVEAAVERAMLRAGVRADVMQRTR